MGTRLTILLAAGATVLAALVAVVHPVDRLAERCYRRRGLTPRRDR